MTVHAYSTLLRWEGSTGQGYRDYPRTHAVSAPPASTQLTLSSDPAFRGDPAYLNPEQLLVMAASSCQLLSFLAVAARRHIDVVGYTDQADAQMDDADLPARISRIVLRPTITVAAGTDHSVVLAAVGLAHEQCYIANSLTTEVEVDATIMDATLMDV